MDATFLTFFYRETKFKNHSKQPSEKNELDPIYFKAGQFLPIFVQSFEFTDSFQSEMN